MASKVNKRFQGLKQFFTGKSPGQISVNKKAGGDVPEGEYNDYDYQELALGPSVVDNNSPYVPETREEQRELFDDMDHGIVSTAVDMYAEDATQFSLEHQSTFWVESENAEVVKICTDLLKFRLEIEDMAFPIARDTAKYGEDFNAIKYSDTAINGWSPSRSLLYKITDDQESLLGYSFESESSKMYSLPWDFAHFRVLGKSRDRKYGTSMLMALIEIDEKLTIMEDSATLFRLLKMPDRDVHSVDCTNLSPAQASRRLQRRRSVINKQKYVDSNSTKIRKRWVPMSRSVGDLFVPTYSGRDDEVESRSTSSRIQDVMDLEYFRRLWCASARIPPEAIGFDFSGGVRFEAGKSLLQQDVQYARKVKRLQRAMLIGLRYMCMLELTFKGIDPYVKENYFKVMGEPISFLDEQQRQELYQAKIGIIDSFSRIARDLELGGYNWTSYLLITFGGFTQDMVDEMFTGEIPSEGTSEGEIPDDVKAKLKEKYLSDVKVQLLISRMAESLKEAFRQISSVSSEDYRFKFPIGSLSNWKKGVISIKGKMGLVEANSAEYDALSVELDRLYKGTSDEIFESVE